MTRVPRLLLPITLALLALGAIAPPVVAAASPRFPTHSVGNLGSDVQALQWLLNDRGFPVAVTSAFDQPTALAVRAFKESIGLPANGVADDATWAKLVMRLESGAERPGVKALQRQLRAKRHIDVPVTGIYDTATRAAVRTFQAHQGITVTGRMDGTTWRWLIGHFELPTFDKTALCDYSVGNANANWGTAAAINQLEAAARVVVKAGHGRVAVGDVSREHGGNIPLHETHERGLDVDIRAMRKTEDQCRWGVNYHWSTYDRPATRALIKAIRAAAPGHVKLIYFNDPVMIKEGLTTWFPGHDDHLHVRYCELSHPSAKYDC